jgi:hypothetical protein
MPSRQRFIKAVLVSISLFYSGFSLSVTAQEVSTPLATPPMGNSTEPPPVAIPVSTPIPTVLPTPQNNTAAPALTPTLTGPSPATASALAVFPGIILHGSGHFYAGRPWVGTALALTEAVSLYCIYRGYLDIQAGSEEVDLSGSSSYSGNSEQVSRGIGLAVGGTLLFFTSWLFDVTGAPQAAAQVQAENKAMSDLQIRPELLPDGSGGRITCAWSFQ